MSSITRRAAAALVAFAASLSVLSAAPADAGTATPMTRITVKTPSCARCDVQLHQAIVRDGGSSVWKTHPKRATEGVTVFDVPTARTHGMSITVVPGWERDNNHATGYVAAAVFRYQGFHAGDYVGFRAARRQDHASGCWAGTDRRAKTFTLRVRKVAVPTEDGTTDGSIVWLRSQARTWAPMIEVRRGVLGTQDAVYCRRP